MFHFARKCEQESLHPNLFHRRSPRKIQKNTDFHCRILFHKEHRITSYNVCYTKLLRHGFPSDYVIKEGDIVSIDCGTVLNGFIGDSAFTYAVGEVNDDLWGLLETTLNSLYKGISVVKVGNRIGDIGHAIQHYAEADGCSVVREMTGHGIGRRMHEDPSRITSYNVCYTKLLR